MKYGRGIFVTGTDTGVGKTVVTAGLLRLIRNHGISAGAMKPVESGCRLASGRKIGKDSRILLAASESGEDPEQVGLYRFKSPLAPLMASRAEGVRIDLNRIVKAYRELSTRHSITFVEGVGGLMVPLTQKATVADLVRRMRLPLLVVAANRLGAINHTLLTVRMAERFRIPVLGIILNQTQPKSGPAVRTNARLLSSVCGVPVIGEVPYIRDLSSGGKRSGGLRRMLKHLDESIHHIGIELNSRVLS